VRLRAAIRARPCSTTRATSARSCTEARPSTRSSVSPAASRRSPAELPSRDGVTSYVQGWRHPFDVAPYAGAACLPADCLELRLDEHDRSLIRRLRPEAAAMWSLTLGTALISVALYCAIWNVPVAVGLVLGMWVHELGHAAVVRRLGLEPGP